MIIEKLKNAADIFLMKSKIGVRNRMYFRKSINNEMCLHLRFGARYKNNWSTTPSCIGYVYKIELISKSHDRALNFLYSIEFRDSRFSSSNRDEYSILDLSYDYIAEPLFITKKSKGEMESILIRCINPHSTLLDKWLDEIIINNF